ncbi:MAG TPA: glycosyltransferase family 2 protein [Bryobacteraceae bacterium]|nr:glycosyltransferase family 2 protein [Bryobacteraceae bacterium]
MPQLRTKVQKRELVAQETATPPEEQEAPKPIRITAIVVSHNRIERLRGAIEALERSEERERLEILVVDNGSTDGSSDLEAEFPQTRFIRGPRNFGLTKALNLGVRGAAGEFLLILHEDSEVSPDTARLLAGVLENQADAGAVCPLLVSPDGEPAPQIENLPKPGHLELNWRAADPAQGEQPVQYARGAALMVRRFFFQSMRQIDERYGNFGSDAEICFQVWRSGKRVLLIPSAQAVHYGRPVSDPGQRARLDADRKLGLATYIRKRYGILRWILLRISLIIRAFGSVLSFRDFRYHFAVFALLWNGQKIDGSQRD